MDPNAAVIIIQRGLKDVTNTGDSKKCGLCVDENPPRLVALGSVYEGSIIILKVPLGNDQVKVGIKEV